MLEIKFYSRGGQGAVTAAKILTTAAMLDGKFAQAIPSYGQERKGAPVFTYGRIDDNEIDVKSYVYRPNCVMCFDDKLGDVGIDIYEGVVDDATLIINTAEKNVKSGNFGHIKALDANKLTHELIGNVPPNVVMLAALAKETKCVTLESLLKAIKMKMKGKVGEINAEACAKAFERA